MKSSAKTKPKKAAPPTPAIAPDVDSAVAWLKAHATQRTRDGMARFNIPSDHAFGVTMRDIQVLAKQLRRNHTLAAELWATGWYEARMLAAYVDDPAQVTAKQMEEWCRDLDNWAICDTICFALFKRVPHAWKKVKLWANRKPEFEKRAAFALLWSLAGSDESPDASFLEGLQLIERESQDERHFVKKAVNMALRGIGKRNRRLNQAAREVAERLATSDCAPARWIGKDALRELKSPAVQKRLED